MMVHRVGLAAAWWTAAIVAIAGLIVPRAEAATIYWDVTTGTWASDASWSSSLDGTQPGSVPTSADVAFFSASPILTSPTVTLAANTVIGGLQFGAGSSGTTVLRTDGTARTLTLGTNGIVLDTLSTQSVTIGGAGVQAITVQLDGSQTWTNDSSGTLTLANNIQRTGTEGTSRTLTLGGSGFMLFSGTVVNGGTAGTLALSKVGSGTLALSSANTFGGGVSLSQGTVQVGNATALGTGTLTWTGGKLSGNGITAFTLTNASRVSGTVQLGDVVNTGNLTLSGNMALTGNTVLSTFGSGTGNFTKDVIGSGMGGQSITGTISGAFSLAKDGGGALILGAANTFTGGLTLRQGIVRVGTPPDVYPWPAPARSCSPGRAPRSHFPDHCPARARSRSTPQRRWPLRTATC